MLTPEYNCVFKSAEEQKEKMKRLRSVGIHSEKEYVFESLIELQESLAELFEQL